MGKYNYKPKNREELIKELTTLVETAEKLLNEYEGDDLDENDLNMYKAEVETILSLLSIEETEVPEKEKEEEVVEETEEVDEKEALVKELITLVETAEKLLNEYEGEDLDEDDIETFRDIVGVAFDLLEEPDVLDEEKLNTIKAEIEVILSLIEL